MKKITSLFISLTVLTAALSAEVQIVKTGDAWQQYQPVISSGDKVKVKAPDIKEIHKLVKSDIDNIQMLKTSDIADLLKKAETAGNDALLWNSVGLKYARAGMMEKAKEMFDKAYKIDPKNCLIKNNMANILYLNKNIKAAIKEYEGCIMLCGDDPKYYINLAKAYLDLNKVDDAIENYKIAITINERFRDNNFEVIIAKHEGRDTTTYRAAEAKDGQDAGITWSEKTELKEKKEYPEFFTKKDPEYTEFKKHRDTVQNNFKQEKYWESIFVLFKIFILSPYNNEAKDMLPKVYNKLTKAEQENVVAYLKRIIEKYKETDPKKANGYREIYKIIKKL